MPIYCDSLDVTISAVAICAHTPAPPLGIACGGYCERNSPSWNVDDMDEFESRFAAEGPLVPPGVVPCKCQHVCDCTARVYAGFCDTELTPRCIN